MAEGAADPVRIAKWISIIVGGILLLLAATAFVMTSVIDPNRYKGKVEAIIADLAGRPFVIDGDLHITWYPWLGVRMGPAHLNNDPGVSGPPLAQWQSLAVAARIFPLLRGEVVVDRVRLQGPHIRLRRDAQGHGNWENLGPRAPASPSGHKTPPQIAGVEIHAGMLEYVDEMSGRRINLSGLELDVGEWRAGQPLPVHARFLIHSDSIPPEGIWLQMNAPELTVRLDPLQVAARKLSVQVADAKVEGDATYERTADAHTSAKGSVAVHAPSLRKLVSDFGLNQTMPHDPTTLGPLELTGHWSYQDGALAAKPLALKLDGVSFSGWLERATAPQSGWRFELHGDRIDLDRYVSVDSTNKKPFELPVAALRAIDANGSLLFDQVQLAGAHMSDVRLKLQTPDAKR